MKISYQDFIASNCTLLTTQGIAMHVESYFMGVTFRVTTAPVGYQFVISVFDLFY